MPEIRVIFNNEEIIHQELDKAVYVIGRQENCDLYIDNLGISRQHARLLRDGDGYLLEDMGSANGTLLNGNPATRNLLADGDEICIGKYVMHYATKFARSMSSIAMDSEPLASSEAAPSGPPMQDGTLQTMQMNGDTLRKQIEDIKKTKTAEEGEPEVDTSIEPEAPAPVQAPGDVSSMELRARDAEIKMLKKSLGSMKLLTAVLFLAVLVLAVLHFAG